MQRYFSILLFFFLFSGGVFAAEALPVDEIPSRPLDDWIVCGPFSNGEQEDSIDLLAEIGGEAACTPSAGDTLAEGRRTWEKTKTDGSGTVNFQKIFGNGFYHTAYAFTRFDSPRDRIALLRVKTGNGFQVWLNHRIVYHDPRIYRLPRFGDHLVPVRLEKGENRILVKTGARGSGWRFSVSVLTPPEETLVLDSTNLLLPDRYEGKPLSAWGSVMAAWCGETAAFSFSPLERRRIPFFCRLDPPPPDSPDKTPVKLKFETGGLPVELTLSFAVRRGTDPFTETYRSRLDGSVQAFSVLLPEKRKEGPFPLLLALHGANVGDRFMIKGYTPKKEWLIVAPYGRGSNRYQGAAGVDVEEVLQAVRERYPVDPRRIVLAGHSMGGYGSWLHGERTPDRFAAVSPSSGVSDYFPRLQRRFGWQKGGEETRSLLAQAQEPFRPFGYVDNLSRTPVFCIHGGGDRGVPPTESRRMVKQLQEGGNAPCEYREVPGMGHWWGERPDGGGAECVDMPELFSFLEEKQRPDPPDDVTYEAPTLEWPGAWGLRGLRLREAGKPYKIRRERLSPSRIRLTVSNLRLFSWTSSSSSIEILDQSTGKKHTWSGDPPLGGTLYFHLSENGLAVSTEPPDLPGKSPDLCGPFPDLFRKPFLLVYGTQGNNRELLDAFRRQAVLASYRWQIIQHGEARPVADTDVTPEQLQSHHLILFGTPSTHLQLGQMSGKLPLKFLPDGFRMGGNEVRGETAAAVCLYPNPLAPDRYAAVVTALTPQGADLFHRLDWDLPDWVLYDDAILPASWAGFTAAGFFDADWR